MFRKIAFFFLIVNLINSNIYSQCTPNPIYQDSTGNIWPLTGFPDGMVGINYYEFWDMKAPSTLIEAAQGDTAFVTVDTLGSIIYIGDWPVDSVVTIDVYDLPPGLTVDCSMPRCTYLGGEIGCANIYGTPTLPGIYDVEIVTNLYSHGTVSITVGGVPLTIPVELDYFSITGKYDTVSRYSINIVETTSTEKIEDDLQINNIMVEHESIYLNINSNNTQILEVSIIDLLGREICNKEIVTNQGEHQYRINESMKSGIYLLSIYNKETFITKKFNVKKDK